MGLCVPYVPLYQIIGYLDSILRVECYCNSCYTNVYLKNEGVNINQIAEAYNCTIAEPGSMSKIKVEGYNETVKSSSLSDRTIICSKCRVTRIQFDPTMRGPNNVLIPLEFNNNLRPHDCDYSYPFFCQWCDAKLIFNKKIRTDKGGLIPLHFEDDAFHNCPKKPASGRNRNIDDV